MAGSSTGTIFKLSTFGESHGIAIGGVIDGVPSNREIDIELVQKELDRRKPGQSSIVTQRKESDTVQFLSGIFEGKTTLKDFCKILKLEDDEFENEKGEAETLAGLILEVHGLFPRQGQTISCKNFTFKINNLEKKRIVEDPPEKLSAGLPF